MKSIFYSWLILLAFAAITVSCNKDEEDIPPPVEETETGILKINLALVIEESNARLKEVNTDDFIVKIFRVVDGQPDELVETYPRFADIPAEIELVTGTYYVEAQNIDPPLEAEFEQPWYYGVSPDFNIDKEDLVSVTVECTLANYKVAFVYSQNVFDNFTTWNAKATRMVSGEFLEWAKDDNREGYFLLGDPFEPVQGLAIEVHLEYDKEFDEGVITRNFYAEIPVPNAATLYRVNIDAVLQDGIISIGINVDDGFDIIDINPIASVTFSGPGDIDQIEGGALVEGSGEIFGSGTRIWDFSDVWLANHKHVYWGPATDEVKGSMDDDVFVNGDPNEILDFDAGSSDLANGSLVFLGTTRVNLPSGPATVDLRFELEVLDNVSQTPRSLTNPADLGLPPSIGGLVEILDINDQVETRFRLLAKNPSDPSYVSFLAYFDAASTPEGAQAYSSFTGGFYWSNVDK